MTSVSIRGLVLPLVAAGLLPVVADEAAKPSATITCSSGTGERQHCPADTSGGVLLVKSTGSGACLLGKTWGYDEAGVWVEGGCSGEFAVGAKPAGGAAAPASAAAPPERIESWGEFSPGENFYPAPTRDHRFNLQVIDVKGSPVSSTFGYYVGGQDGTIVSAGFSVFF